MLLRSWHKGGFGAEPCDDADDDTATTQFPLGSLPFIEISIYGPAHSLGRLFGVVQNYANASTVYLLQRPPLEDVDRYYNQFHTDLLDRSPDETNKYEILGVVHVFTVAHLIDLEQMPDFHRFRPCLLPYDSQRLGTAYNMTWRVSIMFLASLMDTFLPIFKQR
ncbi:hypothetical protein N0V86_007915 [Didymella sp. IMI 355093]|nr:hypothetical protein N0V86_007915 [Didymella sp. IMI 355093]